MRMVPDDTIVAVSSPPGRSGRGLVRVSGPGAMTILGSLLEPPDSSVEQLRAWPRPRRLVTCRLHLPAAESDQISPRRTVTLPAIIVFFPGPASFTGQDMIEVQCPGNPALLDRLIHHIVELGARLAEPGEFTFRAFLAGKLDLTQAEGVAATIAATSDTQLQAASLLREGRLGQFAGKLVADLAHGLALVEAGIDFVDQEDVVSITAGQLAEKLKHLSSRLSDLIAQSRPWGAIETLPKVVLVGPPSSGKSTLFNALLNRPRAVISPIAGTTRDVLAEPLILQNATGQAIECMLVDMAGLDTPHTALDRQAQEAAQRTIGHAELLLELCDSPTNSTDAPPTKPAIRIHAKADLIEDSNDPSRDGQGYDITVSAKTGLGLDELRTLITRRLGNRTVSVSGQMLALQPRHEAALRCAAQHLQSAQQQLAAQPPQKGIQQVELIAASLRQAIDELAGLGGQMTPDDILGRVFATFCIGK